MEGGKCVITETEIHSILRIGKVHQNLCMPVIRYLSGAVDAVIKRHEEEGRDALGNKSISPIRHPNQTKETVEEAILLLRNKYSSWGARKIHW